MKAIALANRRNHQTFGRIDVLVNNAGVQEDKRQRGYVGNSKVVDYGKPTGHLLPVPNPHPIHEQCGNGGVTTAVCDKSPQLQTKCHKGTRLVITLGCVRST